MKKNDIELGQMARDHQARVDWEAQLQTVRELREKFLALPMEMRFKMFEGICPECMEDENCKCCYYG